MKALLMNFGNSGVFKMKKTFSKKILKVVAFTLCVLTAIPFAVACKPSQDNNVEVSLSKSEIYLDLYEGTTLIATVKNSDNQVEWATSDQSIVTVDNGQLIALKGGVAIITATVDGKSAECEVTVWPSSAIPVLELDRTQITVDVGRQFNIEYSIRYKNQPINATVIFTSSSEQVATVNADGVISGLSAGTTTVTITVSYYTFETAKTINVTII